MTRTRAAKPILTFVALTLIGGNRAGAQGGYPSFGVNPYQSRYNVGNGRVAGGYLPANRFARSGGYGNAPLTVTNYQPLYDAITSLPGWYGGKAPELTHKRPPARPGVPIEQLIGKDGKVLWPSATPSDPTLAVERRAAEDAVKMVVEEHRKYGQATVRHVVEAKNKLLAFEKPALVQLWPRNAADAAGLETFILELRKTLETLAVNY